MTMKISGVVADVFVQRFFHEAVNGLVLVIKTMMCAKFRFHR